MNAAEVITDYFLVYTFGGFNEAAAMNAAEVGAGTVVMQGADGFNEAAAMNAAEELREHRLAVAAVAASMRPQR